MFFKNKNKKLYEIDPKEMHLEVLLTFQAALSARLLIVTKELIERFQILLDAANGVDFKNPADSKIHFQTLIRQNKVFADRLKKEIDLF